MDGGGELHSGRLKHISLPLVGGEMWDVWRGGEGRKLREGYGGGGGGGGS